MDWRAGSGCCWTHTGLGHTGGRGYVLKSDVQQYFPSVDHTLLQGLLRRKIGDDRLLWLLDRLIESGEEGGGKGMPIGNLTSQLLMAG